MRKLIVAGFVALGLAGCGGGAPSDQAVANDLMNLLMNKGGAARSILCTHENANEFSCQVTDAHGQQHFAQVSDDGNSVSEIGIIPTTLPLQ